MSSRSDEHRAEPVALGGGSTGAEREPGAHPLSVAIDRTLRDLARRNELVIAWLRAVGLGATACVDTVSALRPDLAGRDVGWAFPAVTWAGTLLSTALLVALLRGFYRPRVVRYVLPAIEAAFIAYAIVRARDVVGVELFEASAGPQVLAFVCSIFAITGAFRLTRGAAITTAGLAIAIYVTVSFESLTQGPGNVTAVLLLATAGGMGLAIAHQMQRVARGEVGRLTLARFLPARVIDGAHDDPLELITRPRAVDVTILVSDVRGFTAWSEGRDPAEVLRVLSELQGALADTVRAHGGTIDKFMGDGMLAVFGAPEPLADHAARAVAAARAMVERASAWAHDRDQPLRIGVGVHSGEVVVGCLGSGERLEFTVIGDTVNTASRLEALTKEKGVAAIASDEVLRRAGTRDGASSLGVVSVRGRTEPLEVFRL